MMKSIMPINIKKTEIGHGFIATTAIILISLGALAYTAIILSMAVSYADSEARSEWRIQANMNAAACAFAVAIMSAKDYFLQGNIYVREFDCTATVARNHDMQLVYISARSKFSGVSSAVFEKNFIIP